MKKELFITLWRLRSELVAFYTREKIVYTRRMLESEYENITGFQLSEVEELILKHRQSFLQGEESETPLEALRGLKI